METKTKHFRKRDAVLNCLRSTTSHPSAEWVFSQLKTEYPDLSLGTVYRNLVYFKNQGIIVSVGTVDGVERFDGNIKPHAHFVCTQCHRVFDLMDLDIPEDLIDQAGRYSGGIVEGCQVTFTGICKECRNG